MERYIFRSFVAALLSLFSRQRKVGFVALAKTLKGFFAEESLFDAIAGHLDFISTFNRPPLDVLKMHADVTNKYFSAYLAKGFSKKVRRKILLHHYRYLLLHVAPDFHAKIWAQPAVLWRQAIGDTPLEIALASNPDSRHEGELSLVFYAMDISIFELSFTIAPGAVVGSAYENVMLVGRVQGGRRFDLIRTATKDCEDVAPKNLLITAAQSVAMALGLTAIVGVGNDLQVGNPEGGDTFFLVDYDEFWQTQLATRTQAGFYELPLPLPQKPLSDVSASHRRRARNRRLYKAAVASAVCETVQPLFLPTDAR